MKGIIAIMNEIKNYTEILVQNALEGYLSHNKVPCSCEICQTDVMVLALNNLPVLYYNPLQNESKLQLESNKLDYYVSAMTEVVSAFKQISMNPSHA